MKGKRNSNKTTRRLLIHCCLWIACFSYAQNRGNATTASEPQNVYSEHYYKRLERFKTEGDTEGEIIFLGNSITEGGDWKALFPEKNVVNRGISGDVTDGILNRIEEVTSSKPEQVFLMVGTNDMARGRTVDDVVKGIRAIITAIRQQSPQTEIVLQSILPVNPQVGNRFSGHKANGGKILEANARLMTLAAEHGIIYVDLHKAMRDRNGYLRKRYTHDGLHLKKAGYARWKRTIKKHL